MMSRLIQRRARCVFRLVSACGAPRLPEAYNWTARLKNGNNDEFMKLVISRMPS